MMNMILMIIELVTSNPVFQGIIFLLVGWTGLKIKDRKIDNLKDAYVQEIVENVTDDQIIVAASEQHEYGELLELHGVEPFTTKDPNNRDNKK